MKVQSSPFLLNYWHHRLAAKKNEKTMNSLRTTGTWLLCSGFFFPRGRGNPSLSLSLICSFALKTSRCSSAFCFCEYELSAGMSQSCFGSNCNRFTQITTVIIHTAIRNLNLFIVLLLFLLYSHWQIETC